MPSARRMPAVKVWTAWLFAGMVASLWLQWAQASAVGGWSGLMATSAESRLRPVIEQELGTVTLLPSGHDGQFSFVIAIDPFNRQGTAALFDDAPYRYRRILYPLLAGGAGLLPGKVTLVGLILLAVLGMGLATASTAALAGRLDISRWVVAAVLANPGVWLGVQLLTSDPLALGLALTAWSSGGTVASCGLYSCLGSLHSPRISISWLASPLRAGPGSVVSGERRCHLLSAQQLRLHCGSPGSVPRWETEQPCGAILRFWDYSTPRTCGETPSYPTRY